MKPNKSPASSLAKPSSSSQPPLRTATPTRPATQTPRPASPPRSPSAPSLSSRPVEPPLRATAATPTNEAIAERARQVWEQQGRPSGRDLEIWLEAERQLQGPPRKDKVADEIEPKMDEIEPDDALSTSIEKEIDEEAPGQGDRRSVTSLDLGRLSR